MPWIREAKRRKTGTRTDIYYVLKGTKVKLRSLPDAEKYCRKYNIEYDKNYFNFSTLNTYEGLANLDPKYTQVKQENPSNLKRNSNDVILSIETTDDESEPIV